MKVLKSVLFLFIAMLGFASIGLAHALYIDTPSEGTVGEKHEVKVYYSEFADRTKEKVADWFSDAAQLELWLVHPDGSRTQLMTTVHEDHLSAGFVPQKKGFYRLEISHTTAEVPEKTAYQFNAFAQVQVGAKTKSAAVSEDGADFVLLNIGKAGDKTKKFGVYLNGMAKANIAVTLFLPSGGTKKLKSDKKGIVHFMSNENGVHFLEATIFQKGQAGKTKQDAFESLWRCATQKINL